MARFYLSLFFGGAAFLAGVPSTLAEGRRFELTWQVPEGCPAHAEVVREVEELTSNATSSHAPVIAQAVIARDPTGFALKLTMGSADAPRSRHIGAPTCEELAHAAALIVAIAVDPSILERRVDPASATQLAGSRTIPFSQTHCRLTDLPQSTTTPADTPCAGRDVATPTPTKTIETVSEPPFWRLGLGSVATFDSATWLGMSLFGAIQGRLLRLEVSASRQSTSVDAAIPGRSADFALYQLAPRACALASKAWFSFGPCAAIELGLLMGRGRGVSNEYDPNALWLASSLGGLFELRLGSSALLAVNAEFGVPWLRPSFELAGEQLYRPKESGKLGVSLAAGWP